MTRTLPTLGQQARSAFGPRIDTATRSRIFQRDHWTCQYCGGSWERAKRGIRQRVLTVDHVIATCRGGSDDDANLVTCCKRCNNLKGARTPTEWKHGLPHRYAHGAPKTREEVMAIRGDWPNDPPRPSGADATEVG